MDKPMIHALADVQTIHIGQQTRIWQFVVVLAGARIGKQCNVCANVLIEGDVEVGDRVTIKSGVQLWDGLRVADDVFIGPNATFSNDLYPRSRERPINFMLTTLHQGCSIGAGAVILPGIEIGVRAIVGAGAVVTRSVPPNAIVVGNPARIVGYVDTNKESSVSLGYAPIAKGVLQTRVKGVTLHHMHQVADIRGSLTVGEFGRSVPFESKRYFMVYGVPSMETRGEHAHKLCHQFLICVAGSCAVVADDGLNREEIELTGPHMGVHLPPMVWGIQYKYSKDAVLLVFASEYYDSADYIRDYAEFLEAVAP
jgi:acetyltransferase-like isoleucine patch superfamily enzyme/dTDP-4-dehydrorhamnose 3,5-epimerase-like enzyme